MVDIGVNINFGIIRAKKLFTALSHSAFQWKFQNISELKLYQKQTEWKMDENLLILLHNAVLKMSWEQQGQTHEQLQVSR